MHHHRTLMTRFHPGYFGKLGMRHIHLKKNQNWCPTINVEKLWSLVGEELRIKYQGSELVPIIDTLKYGYARVLGKGFIPSQPLIVRAREFTEKAKKKIIAVGGICEVVE